MHPFTTVSPLRYPRKPLLKKGLDPENFFGYICFVFLLADIHMDFGFHRGALPKEVFKRPLSRRRHALPKLNSMKIFK